MVYFVDYLSKLVQIVSTLTSKPQSGTTLGDPMERAAPQTIQRSAGVETSTGSSGQ